MGTATVTEEVRSARPRILVVDDHPLVLERVLALLQSDFEVVGTARNGQEMVVEVMRLDPEVIVADITMPELDGIAAARQLRAHGCIARLVFLTIHRDDEFAQACLAEGALGYVTKRQLRTDLIPAIRAALLGRRFVSAKK
jgi:DNA-binding NarL/FixJ family response regulator